MNTNNWSVCTYFMVAALLIGCSTAEPDPVVTAPDGTADATPHEEPDGGLREAGTVQDTALPDTMDGAPSGDSGGKRSDLNDCIGSTPSFEGGTSIPAAEPFSPGACTDGELALLNKAIRKGTAVAGTPQVSDACSTCLFGAADKTTRGALTLDSTTSATVNVFGCLENKVTGAGNAKYVAGLCANTVCSTCAPIYYTICPQQARKGPCADFESAYWDIAAVHPELSACYIGYPNEQWADYAWRIANDWCGTSSPGPAGQN